MTRIVLGGERPISWNKFYSGGHWAKRNEEAQRVHALVRASIEPHTIPDTMPYSVAVHIYVVVYFDKRPMDADNIVAKLYVDGLKPWLIQDDTPQYVRSVTTSSRIDRQYPRIEIRLAEVGDD